MNHGKGENPVKYGKITEKEKSVSYVTVLGVVKERAPRNMG